MTTLRTFSLSGICLFWTAFLLPKQTFSQITLDTIAWITVQDEKFMPTREEGGFTQNGAANAILTANGIVRFEQAMPFAKSARLRRICELRGTGDVALAYEALRSSFPGAFANLSKYEMLPDHAVYDPADWFWTLTAMGDPNINLWHLTKTQCDLAWDITHGSPDIRLGIIDRVIDGDHPDLVSKLVLPYDAYNPSVQFNCSTGAFHGTVVAGMAGAETAETGTTPQGDLASAGFNCMLVGYTSSGISLQTFIAKCVHASTVMGVRTITSCADAGIPCSVPSSLVATVQDAMKEIFDNGTCIVYPAGNGLSGYSCPSGTSGSAGPYAPIGPFFPSYDERVIIVAGTDKDDKHQHYNPSDPFDEWTQSHFPEVDICAPSWDLMGSTPTGCTSGWPYYGANGGTSFASPIVAGICGLILSIQPCLGAEDVQAIIKATADPVVDAANFPGMLGAGRINAYQACLMAQTYGHYAPITSSQTWSGDYFIKDDLVVTAGAVLTITGKLRFSDGSKLIVHQGAKVIVDGGTLTKAQGCHDSFWPGIEVWGTSIQNQSGNPIPTHQGMVVLKNGAVIEHAREAIQTMNPNDWNMIGGVVQVQGTPTQVGATFLNCRRAVSYVAYQNTNTLGQPIANRSYFKYCDFVVDDDYRGGNDFYAHVSMWKVDGIPFSGCHFKNLQTGITQSNKLGQGIISIDAQYTVSGACSSIQPVGIPCPSANLTRSTFEGLDHGIDASVSSTDRTFSVTDCDFTDNVIGVYSNAVNSFHVFRSNFTGGGRQVAAMGAIDQPIFSIGGHHGIYSTGGHGFRIEENNFARSSGAPNLFTGVRINNSKEYNSQVYKNMAAGTDHAFVGEGTCMDPAQAAYVGLQFLCNKNNNPGGQDIYDRKVTGDPYSNYHSIRTQQGSSATPAGNTFTQETVPMDESDFKNNTDWVLNYWYNNSTDPDAKPLDYTSGWVGITYTTHTNGCPSRLDGRVPQQYTQAQMNEVRAEFTAAKAAYVNSAYVYNALMDGGNTDALLSEVQETWPDDAWQLHDALMAKAPYLSTEVMRSVVEKNIMPQAMLLEVLLANPDGTKKEGFIKWLQYDSPYPMPQYMIDLIVGSWDQKTFRTQLESDMGQHHADMSFAADELIGEWKNDSLGIPTDSILARWQQVPSLGARYSEALTHLERGEYGPAKDLMLGLDTQYKLSEEQAKERDDAVAYITLLASFHGAGHDLMHLDGAELASLRNIAAAGCERPAMWAQNILCFGYGECYAPCTGEGATQKMLQLPRPAVPNAAPSPLAVYPNPATSYVALAYMLADAPKDAVLVLRGVDGRELKRMPLNAQNGQQLLDTRSYTPGTYSVELLNKGERIATERLVLKP